jgi:hypothetical protein
MRDEMFADRGSTRDRDRTAQSPSLACEVRLGPPMPSHVLKTQVIGAGHLATEMLIQWQEGLVMQLGCWRSATSGRCRGCANSEVGPAVRIRFPPAASHLRT